MTPSRNVPDSRQLRHAARLRRTSGKWHIMGTMGTSKPAIRTHHCPMIDPIDSFSNPSTGLPQKLGNEIFMGQMGHPHSRNRLINASIASLSTPAALRQQRGHQGAKRAMHPHSSGPKARPIPAQGIALGTMPHRIPSPERATHSAANRVTFGSIGSPATTENGSSLAQMAHQPFNSAPALLCLAS
jgi:hypothetical protein